MKLEILALYQFLPYNIYRMTAEHVDSMKKAPDEVHFKWAAQSRPFKRRSREFYVSLISIAGLLGAILFLIEGIMPVLLLSSIILLFYILSTVEPEVVQYEITSKGVKFAGRLTPWENINSFWFVDRLGSKVVVFETTVIPGRLELVIDASKEKEIHEILSEYLPQSDVPNGVFDRATEWVGKRLPQS